MQELRDVTSFHNLHLTMMKNDACAVSCRELNFVSFEKLKDPLLFVLFT